MDLYVDGCFNKTTGKSAWASVTDKFGNDIVPDHKSLFSDLLLQQVKTPKGEYTVAVCQFADVASQQINGAELVAMVMALRIGVKEKKQRNINSDSQLIVQYWSKGKVNSRTLAKMDPVKKDFMEECKSLRMEFERFGGSIKKISGGENPADLGWHK